MGLTVYPILCFGAVLTRDDVSNCLNSYFGHTEYFTTDAEIRDGLSGMNKWLHDQFKVQVITIMAVDEMSMFMMAASLSIQTCKGTSLAIDTAELEKRKLEANWPTKLSDAARAINLDLHHDHPRKFLLWRLTYSLMI